jgi:hypothetical protein
MCSDAEAGLTNIEDGRVRADKQVLECNKGLDTPCCRWQQRAQAICPD